MRARTLAKIVAISGLAFAGGLALGLALLRRAQNADPLTRADRLIERCDTRMAEIEESLPRARRAAKVPA